MCGLLLLATMINYIDRLTLNLMAKRIMDAFGLDDHDYGQLESAFGSAFALGAIVMGFLVDRWNVRWLYPAAVILWSLAGFATGLVQGFAALLTAASCSAERGRQLALRPAHHPAHPDTRGTHAGQQHLAKRRRHRRHPDADARHGLCAGRTAGVCPSWSSAAWG